MGIGKRCSVCTPDVRSLPGCSRRAEDKTHPAFCQRAAKRRYPAGHSCPSHRTRTEHQSPQESGSVLQRRRRSSRTEHRCPDHLRSAHPDAGTEAGCHHSEKMGLPVGDTPGLGPWRSFLERRHKAEKTEPIHIALVGKYDLQDAYKSIREALSQAGTYNDRKVSVDFVNSEKLTDDNIAEALKGMSGVLIGPGFGERGINGKFVAIKYARTHDIPTFGICLGMQCIAIEFARDVLGYADANSREMDEKTPHNVIDIMEEQKSITNMGGTMRLGAYECVLQKGSKAYEAYGTEHIQERHRHRYEFNNLYKAEYEAAGMKCTGINPESDLVEIVEIPTLRWYIGTQFHPEYSSTVLHPHPLFVSFVKAAIEYHEDCKKNQANH